MKYYHGYTIVASVFINRFVGLGTFYSLGLYISDIQRTFHVGTGLAALYPSIIGGISFLAVMFSGPAQDALVKRNLGIQPTFAWGGLFLGGGCIGSSYAINFGIFLFCSVLTAIGLGFTAWASPGVASLWFVRRKGVAVSLALMGSGLGTFAYVMATNKLLAKFQPEECRQYIMSTSVDDSSTIQEQGRIDYCEGWRDAMRYSGIFSGIMLVIASVALRIPSEGEVEKYEQQEETAEDELDNEKVAEEGSGMEEEEEVGSDEDIVNSVVDGHNGEEVEKDDCEEGPIRQTEDLKEIAIDETQEFSTFDQACRLSDSEVQSTVRNSSHGYSTLFMNTRLSNDEVRSTGRSMSDIGPSFKQQMTVDPSVRRPQRSTTNATRSSILKMARQHNNNKAKDIVLNVLDHAAPVQSRGRASILDLFPNRFDDGDDERKQRRAQTMIGMALGRDSYIAQPALGLLPTLSLSESTRTRTYTCLIIWGLLASFAYDTVFIFIPLSAEKAEISSELGSLALSLTGPSLIVGNIVIGFLSDAVGYVRSLQVSMFVCSIAVFVWPFCTTGWSLCLFAVIYSFFASAFPTKVSIIAEAYGEISRGCIMTLFAIFEVSCSPGTFLGPVITGALTEKSSILGGIYFLGGTFLLGNLALLRVPKPDHQRHLIMEKYT